MISNRVRALLVADTHLGFDLPFRPRIQRRRRGHDFFANFERALRTALDGKVDLVIHGGDLLYRTRVPASLVEMAMAPMIKVAEQGIPVFIVPGNHERSRIPLHLWGVHPNIHIFDSPRTFQHDVRGLRVALSGFPFTRDVRDRFQELLLETRYDEVPADIRFLCLHQTVEGATVGPSDYVFRSGVDVIRGVDVPEGFAAILSGHIHRSQRLERDLRGRVLGAPVLYPGSIERTSFAERDEAKHYLLLAASEGESPGGSLDEATFVDLPARPMATLTLRAQEIEGDHIENVLEESLSALDPDAVVRIRVEGRISQEARGLLTAERLRRIAPASMNVSLRVVSDMR